MALRPLVQSSKSAVTVASSRRRGADGRAELIALSWGLKWSGQLQLMYNHCSCAMIRALGLASLACVAVAETYKPIIGVITQPTKVAQDAEEYGPPVSEARAAAGEQGEYIAASYIKFVEAAGGRAVPIHYSADEATLTSLAKSVNGILLPGGAVSLSNSSVYYQAGQTLYNAAVKFNDAGEHFPIWGTCLGV